MATDTNNAGLCAWPGCVRRAKESAVHVLCDRETCGHNGIGCHPYTAPVDPCICAHPFREGVHSMVRCYLPVDTLVAANAVWSTFTPLRCGNCGEPWASPDGPQTFAPAQKRSEEDEDYEATLRDHYGYGRKEPVGTIFKDIHFLLTEIDRLRATEVKR